MADVDFSNAVLDVNTGYTPLASNKYLHLDATYFSDGNHKVNTNESASKLIDTPTKVSFLYTGEFTTSGTEFYIIAEGVVLMWKVSNISFSAGDTYSFIIDIEVEGNT